RTRIDQFDAQLEQLRAPGERSVAERTKADDYARQLAAVYAPAGIEDTDMERAAQAWDAGVGHAEAYRASSARLAELESQRAAAKSVRRAVIPRLKSQLQGQLSPITNGRYRDVRIGEDLALQVRTPDQRTYKDVDNLSLGTRSLIYLLERLALARIIGGNSEPPPLLLDEALVHADRRRLRAAMDELGR